MKQAIIYALVGLISCSQPALAGVESIERKLSAMPPRIDPGPKDVRIKGTFVIVTVPAHQVRAACPQTFDRYALACTNMQSRVVTMPDEESSGLSTDRWLALLRHEMLHAMGLDFHGPR